jgi:hypothetical protein
MQLIWLLFCLQLLRVLQALLAGLSPNHFLQRALHCSLIDAVRLADLLRGIVPFVEISSQKPEFCMKPCLPPFHRSWLPSF